MKRLSLFAFLGSALTFALEPMVGRMLLPTHGGAFYVWTTALTFFQGALLVGYLYAHYLAHRVGRWHILVLLAPLAFVPLAVPGEASPTSPILDLLLSLTLGIGVPFAVLASTSVVAQRWLADSTLEGQQNPYPLFAWSNAGSMVALVGYALVIEPFFGIEVQRIGWSLGYGLYVAVALVALSGAQPATAPSPKRATSKGERIPARTALYWLALSGLPAAYLLGVTNVMTLEIGNVPLVWIVPLALYLGSFVLVFRDAPFQPRWLRRFWPHIALIACFAFYRSQGGAEFWLAPLHLVALLVVCLAAHGELHRTRPPPAQLTHFYVIMAFGGWLGGAFVALAAPRLFDELTEYPLALIGLGFTFVLWHGHKGIMAAPRGVALSLLALAALSALALAFGAPEAEALRVLEARRSPYGTYRVMETVGPGPTERRLASGNTVHGRERLDHPGTPISYYAPSGPLGAAVSTLEGSLRVGVIGLGVGGVTGHFDADDDIVFYEIDPLVLELAERHFGYLSGEAPVRTVLGDARLSLAAEARAPAARGYDLLLVDAFTGDAVPVHLLTVEAVALYLSRIALEDGLVLVHISSRYYDLAPFVVAAASDLGAFVLDRADGPDTLEDASHYLALTRSENLRERLREAGFHDRRAGPDDVAWTDDHASTLHALFFARAR